MVGDSGSDPEHHISSPAKARDRFHSEYNVRGTVEMTGFEPASGRCKRPVLPLNDIPKAAKQGLEPQSGG